jgi:hypothetical protein
MNSGEISELYAAVAAWATSIGAEKLNLLPGVWHRKTEKAGNIGPLDVRINAHTEEIEGIPPFSIRVGMDDYLPGTIALIGPTGGVILGSHERGEDEAGLIAHFKAQTKEKASA